MSTTVVVPSIGKFYNDLKMKERIAIQREMDVPLAQAMSPKSPYLDELCVHFAYHAARRLHRDDITMSSLEDMTNDEIDETLTELMAALGFEDEVIELDDDGVPLVIEDLVTKSESSEETSETENSLTSTTNASSQDG